MIPSTDPQNASPPAAGHPHRVDSRILLPTTEPHYYYRTAPLTLVYWYCRPCCHCCRSPAGPTGTRLRWRAPWPLRCVWSVPKSYRFALQSNSPRTPLWLSFPLYANEDPRPLHCTGTATETHDLPSNRFMTVITASYWIGLLLDPVPSWIQDDNIHIHGGWQSRSQYLSLLQNLCFSCCSSFYSIVIVISIVWLRLVILGRTRTE